MQTTVHAARFAAAVYDVPGQAAWRVRIGGRYVVTVGGIAPECGSIELLEAHAELVQEHPALADVRLVVAGTPEGECNGFQAEFRQRAAELGTAPVVLDDLPSGALPALVAGAAAFVHLPSVEDDCATALEALAAGVPVVARDLPGVRAVLAEVVAYGDTVLSIADALVDVLTDPPEPDAGVALAAAWASSEDRVVQEQPDRGDGREE